MRPHPTPEELAALHQALTAPLTTDPELAPRERAAVIVQGADPDLYVVHPVICQVPADARGHLARMPTPGGLVEVVVVPMHLIIPAEELRISRLLGPDGQPASPLHGMILALQARLVLPRERLAAPPPPRSTDG